MIEVRYRRGRAEWRFVQPLWPCYIGLHFMTWDMQRDGYVCPCGRQALWAEAIRP